MIHSIRAVAKRPIARRWLAATAGLALSMAAVLPAKAQETGNSKAWQGWHGVCSMHGVGLD